MSDRLADMNIEPTLKYLLTRSDPFICLVKGQWGVGKTYFIKKFIRENRAVIAKSNFAYISLFGVSSIEELIQAIFVNSVSTKTLDTTLSDALSSDEALTTRAKYLFDRAKPLLARAGGLPIFGVNAMRGFTLGTMAHFFNRNSLIVIDDLERHSAGLSVRDILGVITQLKEERGCQIIIVMNEDALTKDSDSSYFETKEKVIDRELTFEPTVDEAIAIGLTDYQGKNSRPLTAAANFRSRTSVRSRRSTPPCTSFAMSWTRSRSRYRRLSTSSFNRPLYWPCGRIGSGLST
jgi:Cdc6-like AAA superfamily ATPase